MTGTAVSRSLLLDAQKKQLEALVGSGKEKAHNILNVLVPCDCGFDLFLNL